MPMPTFDHIFTDLRDIYFSKLPIFGKEFLLKYLNKLPFLLRILLPFNNLNTFIRF